MQDVIKKGFLEQQVLTKLNLTQVLIILSITLLIGLFIFFIYRFTFDGVLYSHRYNASILLVGLITSLIIMTIQSNIILSLGMVGALSIVRFRTALKEPMDIVYMFWSIAVGITAGSGLFYIAVGGSLFIGLVMILLSLIKTGRRKYLLVISYNGQASEPIDKALAELKKTVKSKILTGDKVELTLELKYNKETEKIVQDLNRIENVNQVSLINFEENIV